MNFKLSMEDLNVISTIADNEQIGRLYKAEIDELVRVYKWAMALQTNQPLETGCKDRNCEMICLGDKVVYRNQNKYIKKEYWNPVYRVVWLAPKFSLEWLDEGGLDGESYDVILKYGGGSGQLEIIDRSKRIYKI